MSPVDVLRTVRVASGEDFDRWLRANASREREVVVEIYNRASSRQTVGLVALQEVALCHGWVDTQTRRIDAQRYAIRFVPRRAGSHWSPKNRDMARKLITDGRMTAAGLATLPGDL